MKPTKRNINGILLLDKPAGLSSNAALQKVKRLYQAVKAGHTGSLDPLATGMLVICFGKATKLSHLLLNTDKQYQVTAKLGATTTTGDAEGDIVTQMPAPELSASQLEKVLAEFRGDIQQIPPMFSALKQGGQPLYKLARQGIEVPRKARPITIHDLQLIDYSGDQFSLQVNCSKGTYIRSLAMDIGEALGCGAYVTKLRRLAVGAYQKDQMVTLESLSEEDLTALDQRLLPMDTALQYSIACDRAVLSVK